MIDEPYLLGTDAEEGRRLEAQHRVWSAETRDLWDRAGFGAGASLLDLGCGPGYAAIDLARRVGPGGRVLAVDQSRRFIDALDREKTRLGLDQLMARVDDVEQLRLDPGLLAGVFARWLFCFLPDPGAVIARVVPALRSGGRFVVGGRLPALLADHGCRVRELVPMVRFARPGSAFWEWPKRFFFGYAPRLVECGLLTTAELAAFETEWHDREQNPAAFLSTPPMVGIIAEKK